jgi:NAD(P)-dependent dehydrogenase (short-subunit alcohol dehydrogenase family)
VALECRRAVESVIAERGKIDVLCNCAGVAIRKDIVELTEDEWDLALDVTLKGIYLLSREVVPDMVRVTAEAASSTSVRDGRSKEGRGPRPTALLRVGS